MKKRQQQQPQQRLLVRRRPRRSRPPLLSLPDPPPYQANPWNTIVLEATFALSSGQLGVMNVTNLVDLLRAQLRVDVFESTWWLFKVHEVGLWEITGQELGVTFCDLDSGYSDAGPQSLSALAEKVDVPARNHWAHLYFRWPRDNRNDVLDNKNHQNRQILRVKAPLDGSSSVTVHIRVSWRTSYEEVPGRAKTPSSRYL